MRFAATIFALLLLAAPALAQSSRYAPMGDDKLQQFTDELSTLIDEAEKARAADYRFLRDLRDLVRRYDQPWRVELLHDDFRDGDYTANPEWMVKAGDFTVDWRNGLQSRIEKPAAEQPAQQPPRETKKKDVAKALLGALLQEALKDDSNDQQPATEPAPASPGHGQIYVAKTITNAFAIRLEITSTEGWGQLAMGPYQGAEQNAGYSLAYNPGATPSLELLRISGRGTSTLDSNPAALTLEDGATHTIEWTRDTEGAMAVSVDGETLLRVTDRGFRDPFDGFTLVNFGGDYTLREITISGTAPN
jgi:hypothetical protein